MKANKKYLKYFVYINYSISELLLLVRNTKKYFYK